MLPRIAPLAPGLLFDGVECALPVGGVLSLCLASEQVTTGCRARAATLQKEGHRCVRSLPSASPTPLRPSSVCATAHLIASCPSPPSPSHGREEIGGPGKPRGSSVLHVSHHSCRG